MIRRTVIVVIAAASLGLLGFVFLSWRPAIAPIERSSPASFTRLQDIVSLECEVHEQESVEHLLQVTVL